VQAPVATYKLIKKVKDDLLDEELLHTYSLILQIGARDLQFLVADAANKALLLEDYVFSEVEDQNQHNRVVEDLLEAHPLATAGFWKSVTICFKHNKFVQVPESLFVPEAQAEYLALNAVLDPSTEAYEHCHADGIVTVFAIQKSLQDFFQKTYQRTGVRFVHQSAALIKGTSAINQAGLPVFLYVDRFKLHVLFHQDQRLVYYNQFPIKQFSDYVKYIVMVMSVLGLDQQKNGILLWGYIGQNSPHYEEFIKYIKNVSFGGRPATLKFGYVFDEVQDHHYFDLFSAHYFAA
jgi:hypothetical protein